MFNAYYYLYIFMSNVKIKVEAEKTTANLVNKVYEKLKKNISLYEKVVNRPITLCEKILVGHLANFKDIEAANDSLIPTKSYVLLKPDRVALQDVTGQMTILQFSQAGLKQTAVPTTVHCDHLIQARVGSEPDTKAALYENNEVYQFLESASRKYGVGFWKPGAGIIHQVVLENYAFPGGLMIGTDSHTPNAGGLGMLAIGVGGLDAAEVMAGLPWELLYPKRIGVYLTGKLNGWTSPKDVILYLASKLTVSGGTNAIIEYFGPGTKTISCTGKATITNMGAEIGATCLIFPYDKRMDTYLRATRRGLIADLANQHRDLLVQDPEIEEVAVENRDENIIKYFDRLIEIDLSKLEPHIVGPHTPDLARPISKMATDVKSNNYIDAISVALIGSCTNSSYDDMSRAADIAKQARAKRIKTKVPLQVTSGSEMIRTTIERDSQMQLPVADQNYGEGSSREHAAMSPRYLGCAAVIARCFARIQETSLKKQGVLTVTFKDPLDYDKVKEYDRISITGLNDIKSGNPIKCVLHHNNGADDEEIYLQHSYNEIQIEWFYAGSALNVLLYRKKTTIYLMS